MCDVAFQGGAAPSCPRPLARTRSWCSQEAATRTFGDRRPFNLSPNVRPATVIATGSVLAAVLRASRRASACYSRRASHAVSCSAKVGESREADEESWYFSQYGRVATHREMLEDEARTEAYRRAIFATCKGKIVLEVGCGTGILSLFAAQAGAKRVIAVEASERIAGLASKTVERNGFGDRIVVVNGCIEVVADEVDVQVRNACLASGHMPESGPPKVDVIISEWMGFMLVHEDMFPSVAFARDRWLAPGGALIPAGCSLWAVPFCGDDLVEELTSYWRDEPYDLDLSSFATSALEEQIQRPVIDVLTRPQLLLARPERIWQVRCLSAAPSEQRKQRLPFNFAVRSDGRLHGLALWFTCGLAPGVAFSTGPESPPTHWGQTLLFASLGSEAHGLDVIAGDRIRGELSWEAVGRGTCVDVNGEVDCQRGAVPLKLSFDWTLRPQLAWSQASRPTASEEVY